MAIDPPVLLMDSRSARSIRSRAQSCTRVSPDQQRAEDVVIVTHDWEAFALGDRVGVLDGGRLIADDRPEVVAASANRSSQASRCLARCAAWPGG